MSLHTKLSAIGIYLFMLLGNYFTPLYTDDYYYAFILGEDKVRVTSLADVVLSQYNHYFTHGGRLVAHTIDQLFLMLPKLWFDAASAGVFLLLLLVICAFANKNMVFKQIKAWQVLFAFSMLWICGKDFNQVIFWQTGACNYLWTITIVLAFMWLYGRSMQAAYRDTGSVKYYLLASAGGLLAGWTNENTALTMLAVLAVITIYAYKNNYRRSCGWMLTGLAFATLAAVLMITAPGNFVREAETFSNVTLADQLNNSLKVIGSRLMVKQLLLWLCLAGGCYIIHKNYARLAIEADKLWLAGLFVVASLLNNLVMLASPHFPARAGFASTIFLTVAVIIVLTPITGQLKAGAAGKIKTGVTALIAAFMAASMAITIQQGLILHTEDMQRITYINEQKAQGQRAITLKPYSVNDNGQFTRIYLADIYPRIPKYKEDMWVNKFFADYYELDSVDLEH